MINGGLSKVVHLASTTPFPHFQQQMPVQSKAAKHCIGSLVGSTRHTQESPAGWEFC